MFYKFQCFTCVDEETGGIVEIKIDPKRGYARVLSDTTAAPNYELRKLLEAHPDWKIHTVGLTTREDFISGADKGVHLLRGDSLLDFLKAPDAHADTALKHVPEEWHKRIFNQREVVKQQMLDLKKSLMTRKDKPACAGILAYCTKTGRFLFNQRAKGITAGGQWSVFGGYSEMGETPEKTAVREFAEETGLTVAPDKLIRLWTYEDDIVYYNFLLPVDRELKCEIDPKESLSFQWMDAKMVSYENNFHEGVLKLFHNDETVKKLMVKSAVPASFRTLVDKIIEENDDDPEPEAA